MQQRILFFSADGSVPLGPGDFSVTVDLGRLRAEDYAGMLRRYGALRETLLLSDPDASQMPWDEDVAEDAYRTMHAFMRRVDMERTTVCLRGYDEPVIDAVHKGFGREAARLMRALVLPWENSRACRLILTARLPLVLSKPLWKSAVRKRHFVPYDSVRGDDAALRVLLRYMEERAVESADVLSALLQGDYVELREDFGIETVEDGRFDVGGFLSALWALNLTEEVSVGGRRYYRALDIEGLREFTLLRQNERLEEVYSAVRRGDTAALTALLSRGVPETVRIRLQLALLAKGPGCYRVYYRFENQGRRLFMAAAAPGEDAEFLFDIGFIEEAEAYVKLRRRKDSEGARVRPKAGAKTVRLSLVLFTNPRGYDRIQKKVEQETNRW